MKVYGMKDENIINLDNNGKPIYGMSIRDILICLGAKLKNKKWYIDDNAALDIVPKMFTNTNKLNYNGENCEYVTGIKFHPYNKFCSVFKDSKLDNIEVWRTVKFYPGAYVISKNAEQVDKYKFDDVMRVCGVSVHNDTVTYTVEHSLYSVSYDNNKPIYDMVFSKVEQYNEEDLEWA